MNKNELYNKVIVIMYGVFGESSGRCYILGIWNLLEWFLDVMDLKVLYII